MKSIFVASMLLFTFVVSAAAQPAADHLKCFKVKDSQAKAAYVADLDGLLAESGCEIKVPAKMACVPSTKTNVQPAPPGGGATGTPNAFGCYKIKCPKGVAPPLVLNDQFGSRTVTPGKSQIVCAPSTPDTTSACRQPFEPLLKDAVAMFALRFGSSGNFEVPPSCGGSPATCCPGGTPISPCGPLHLDLASASIVEVTAASRLDVTYVMRAATVADIPLTLPVVGDCLLKIDTTPGASPTVQYDVGLTLSADHVDIIGTNALLSGLTSDDVTLSGGLGCQFANLPPVFYAELLMDVLDGQFRSSEFCRLCDSRIAECGP